ncbi:MAG TPA: MarC family protein [Thermomicrobiales bacterium]|nr:MarC family protein [Thermomicrobiales bacterium]
MDFESITATSVVDIFLMLLIGIGPKLALVPFLHATAGMPEATKRLVLRKMLTTAGMVAAVLLVLGGLLTRLLHFSTGALSVASGIILFSIAIRMVLGRDDPDAGSLSVEGKDPLQLAIVPLGVPYLLNPAGIVVLVTASAEAATVGVFAVVVLMLVTVLALDVVVFRWANQVSEHLVENRMLVVEMVFGFLLAALAVQLALNGLSDVGVVRLTSN